MLNIVEIVFNTQDARKQFEASIGKYFGIVREADQLKQVDYNVTHEFFKRTSSPIDGKNSRRYDDSLDNYSLKMMAEDLYQKRVKTLEREHVEKYGSYETAMKDGAFVGAITGGVTGVMTEFGDMYKDSKDISLELLLRFFNRIISGTIEGSFWGIAYGVSARYLKEVLCENFGLSGSQFVVDIVTDVALRYVTCLVPSTRIISSEWLELTRGEEKKQRSNYKREGILFLIGYLVSLLSNWAIQKILGQNRWTIIVSSIIGSALRIAINCYVEKKT